jgi:hypothetical protein
MTLNHLWANALILAGEDKGITLSHIILKERGIIELMEGEIIL